MRDFNKKNRSGGRDRERPEMHKARCDECGRSCEVPFRPSGDKPIFCDDCFASKRGDAPRRNEERSSRDSRDFRSSRFEEKRMYAATCDKCGNACEVPFQPTSGKPIFCNQCFGSGSAKSNLRSGDDGQLKDQLKALNVKLDRILKILEPIIIEDKKESAPKKKGVEVIEKIKDIKISEPKEVVKKATAKKVVAKKATTKKKK